MDFKEKRFEDDIESYLLSEGGYVKGSLATYDAARAIDMTTLIAFIKSSQPKTWDRYIAKYPDEPEKHLQKTLINQVNASGLIHALRNGIDDLGIKIFIAFFKPEHSLTQESIEKYDSNILQCTRQFAYSTENNNTIDMVLLLNGIPFVAIELKNQLTGQSIEHGQKQWMYDRNPKEAIFNFNRRILAYFSADLYNVIMTTKLAGKETYFLPFNQGSNGAGEVGGPGNPVNPDGYATSYLWENVLSKDSIMDILHRYIHLAKEERHIVKNGQEKITYKETIIFPRYHQLDVVTKIISDVKEKGSGENYLIQHSAGSGKSNSIAWLSYRLSSIHDAKDNSIFRSVIVVTDRKVLDSQLQETISGFDHTPGLVVSIGEGKSSKDLKEAINDGKKIIITTLQKFPVIYKELDENKGRNFAIIVDEAHSSQTGESARKLKEGLADKEEALKEFAEIEALEEEKEEDSEDIMVNLVNELLSHGKHKNLSFFAFTATPKTKTIEMFGNKADDGKFYPFHIYSMKQAIKEGFIMDVLKNYVTYKTFYKIIKNTPDNPEVAESPAKKAVRRYQTFHPYVLRQKTEVIVEQFREVTLKKMSGRAKAMVVTSSRLHAIRYYNEFKKYIEEKNYKDIGVLVAFSGEVNDKDEKYTESGLNMTADGKSISEKQLRSVFSGEDFNILIVAEKYQTGFDEPLLHTMFVDKKLQGIKAVQTLSRINRIHPLKQETFILDFVNEAEDIQEAFKPYFESTKLSEEIDYNLVYEYRNHLQKYNLWNDEDIEKFSSIYYKTREQTDKDLGKIAGVLKPTIDRYNLLTDEARYEFKGHLRNFNHLYSYIAQITRMFDKNLHKLYIFTNYINKIMPPESRDKLDLEEMLKLEYNKLKETFQGSIELDPSEEETILQPQGPIDAPKPPDEKKELLEEIIRKINETFQGKFTEADRIMIEILFNKCSADNKTLTQYAKKNEAKVFVENIFPTEFSKIAQDCYLDSMDAFSKLYENEEFYKQVMEKMGQEIYKNLRSKKKKVVE